MESTVCVQARLGGEALSLHPVDSACSLDPKGRNGAKPAPVGWRALHDEHVLGHRATEAPPSGIRRLSHRSRCHIVPGVVCVRTYF